jgi:hypothetical protein
MAIIPTEVEESRGVARGNRCGILRLRFAQHDRRFTSLTLQRFNEY